MPHGLPPLMVTTAIAVPLCYTYADDFIAWLRRRVTKRTKKRAAAMQAAVAANGTT